jgi:aspartate/methionine/tyrosine aminotransferase
MTGGPSLPDFRLEVHLGRWEFSAPHHLTASDAQTLTIRELLAMASDDERRAFESLPLSYVPVRGGGRLLRAIADTYEAVGPDDILSFAGAEEAIFWTMQDLVGPGEHAVLTVPNYQSMESVALATGAEVSGLPLRPETGWSLDLDELEGLLRPETRLVAVNFPNNPTGGLAEPADLRRLAALCDERDIRLFSDEVYRGLELDSERTLPQAADLSPTAVSVNVMSKAYGLPGLRIGWIACRDRALLERLERRRHYTSICNSAPSELLAAIALRNDGAIRARNRGIIAANLPIFDAFFARHEELFEWEPPAGGCVCFPRYLGEDGVEEFCRGLVEEAGVVLLPASIFHSRLAEVPADRFRIGVGRRDPEPALAAFEEFLARSPAVR